MRLLRAGRRRRFAAAAVFAAALAAVPAALAIHDFTDVPDASPFHGDIAAVKRAGITSGKTCVPPGTPPTYCPGEPITREAMAAFVHRGLGRLAYTQIPLTQLSTSGTSTTLGSLSLTTGGVAGGNGFVRLEVTYTVRTFSNATCPCIAQVMIFDDAAGVFAPTFSAVQLNELGTYASAPTGLASGSVSWVKQVDTGTTYTFTVVGAEMDGAEPLHVHGDFTAEYFPFGSTGTSSP